MSNRIPDVRRLLSQSIEKRGIYAVSRELKTSTTCLYRYESGEREMPFVLGWAIHHGDGPAPDLRKILAKHYESGTATLREIGERLGLDGDTVGAYISGKRKRILWSTGWRILHL